MPRPQDGVAGEQRTGRRLEEHEVVPAVPRRRYDLEGDARTLDAVSVPGGSRALAG